MSSYAQVVEQLYSLGYELAKQDPSRFDLALERNLLRALGNPERRFQSVLIAGTNGKGSTAATLASILTAAGHRTGLYTSPHLVRPNERLRLNHDDISDDDFVRVYALVEAAAQQLLCAGKIPRHPSFFEMLTAMAFVWFADSAVEVAVLEVGLGGRLDATNVVEPVLSIITDISFDHQNLLGNSIAQITREKVGILRAGGILITLPQHPEANEVIGNTALELGARLITPIEYVPAPMRAQTNAQPPATFEECFAPYYLDVLGLRIQVDSPLKGAHQHRNIALAIAAAEQLHTRGVTLTPRDIETGIRTTHWPGRFQIVRVERSAGMPMLEFVFDVAHNPAGAWALRAALSRKYLDRSITFVFGLLNDKELEEMASILFPLAHRVVATRAENPRSLSPEEIRSAAQRWVDPGHEVIAEEDVISAIQRACSDAERYGVVVVTGSVYVVGEGIAALRFAK